MGLDKICVGSDTTWVRHKLELIDNKQENKGWSGSRIFTLKSPRRTKLESKLTLTCMQIVFKRVSKIILGVLGGR